MEAEGYKGNQNFRDKTPEKRQVERSEDYVSFPTFNSTGEFVPCSVQKAKEESRINWKNRVEFKKWQYLPFGLAMESFHSILNEGKENVGTLVINLSGYKLSGKDKS